MTILSRSYMALGLVFLVGVVVRIVFVSAFLTEGFAWPDEMDQYYSQALRLSEGLGWGDNTKVLPVFPFLLSFIFTVSNGDLFITRLLLALINSSLILAVYILAKRLLDKKVALVAALITSLYPILIYSSGLLLPEAFFSILVCAGLASLLPARLTIGNMLLAGLFLGFATLTIPLTIPFLLLSVLVLLSPTRFTPASRRLSHVTTYVLFLAIVLGGWGIRNYLTLGQFLLVKTNVGEVLYLHNNASASGFDRRGNRMNATAIAPDMEQRVTNELARQRDQEYLRSAVAFIRSEPHTFLRLCVERFLNLWRFYPRTISSNDLGEPRFRLVSVLTYGPIFICSLVGLLVQRKAWRRHLVVYSYLLSLILTFTLFRSSMRARLTLEPLLVIYGSAGVICFRELLSARFLSKRKGVSHVR